MKMIRYGDKVFRTPLEQIKKNQEDIEELQSTVDTKQDKLTAGDGINITNNIISVDDTKVVVKDSYGNVDEVLKVARLQSETAEEDDDCKANIYLSSGRRRSRVTLESQGEEAGSSIILQGTTSIGSEGTVEIAGETNFTTNSRITVTDGNGDVEEIAYLSDVPTGETITASRGIIKTGNNLALEEDIYIIKNLIGLNSNGKTVLRTPTGFQYVLAEEFDPNASYYARTRIPTDPTKAKGTWIIDEDWNPSDFGFGINAAYYFVGGNSPDASKSRGYSIIKNSSGWVMYNYYDVVVGGNNSMQAYPINGGWGENARNLGIPNETSAFDGMLAHCTKFSEKVLGVDAENMEDLEMVSYEYTPVELTEETFIPDTYYVIQTEYTEVLLEDIIAAIGGN